MNAGVTLHLKNSKKDMVKDKKWNFRKILIQTTGLSPTFPDINKKISLKFKKKYFKIC